MEKVISEDRAGGLGLAYARLCLLFHFVFELSHTLYPVCWLVDNGTLIKLVTSEADVVKAGDGSVWLGVQIFGCLKHKVWHDLLIAFLYKEHLL
jgi:hypothetical protein